MLSVDRSVHLDPTIVKVLRLLGVSFGVILGALLFFTAETGIGGNAPHPAISYICALLIAGTGFLHIVWNPFTARKLAFYHVVFSISGAVASTFSFGFDLAPLYPAWATLFFANYMFFGRWAILVYLAFVTSGITWLLANSARLTSEDFILVAIGLVTEGFLFVLLVFAWRFAEDRQRRLEKSRLTEQIERKRLEGLVNSIVDSVITVDEAGVVKLYNAATLSLLDTNKNIKGSLITDLMNLVDDQNKPVNIMELAQQNHTESTLYNNFYNSFADGDRIALSIKIAPISLSFPEKGQGGFAFIVSDITKLKSLEEERDEFISVVSHELRTPIAITEGTLSNMMVLAQRSKADLEFTKGLGEAHEQVIYLSKMINDLAALSRAEHSVNLETEMIDIDNFAHSLYQQYEPQAKAAGLKLDLDIANKVGQLETNQLYLEEILQNLLTNAIKYTPAGSVKLQIKKLEQATCFVVSDTGHGISKSDQKKIFNKFYRSEDYRTRETGGTGLGLYVAQQLSDKLGGHIELESRLNHGSTFSFVLPNQT